MDEAPAIIGVEKDTDEEPQEKYDTTYVEIIKYQRQDGQKDDQEDHK